jgi:DNA polymerase III epsilon subunit-like protein
MRRKLLVVDTETTGLDASRHSILSFAAVIYQDGGVSGEFETLVAEPNMTLSREAAELNGISIADLISAPSPWGVVQAFTNWLAKNEVYGPQVLVAHKTDFDVAFLQRLWRLAGADFERQFGHRYMCTQACALLLEQAGRLNLPGGSASLDGVAAALGLPGREGAHHSALEDARLCARVLAKMVEKLK